LIIDRAKREIVALPFPKFFNLGEMTELPDEPFEVFEKLDGSLIILFYHNGEWKTATKGSLASVQALWAKEFISKYDLIHLNQNYTYLCEAVGPQNRIVVPYKEPMLVLLACYNNLTGYELSHHYLRCLSQDIGWGVADNPVYNSLTDLVEHTKTLDKHQEGFVVRYNGGTRVKIKGEEYLRIHRLVSHVTPLSIWECMKNDDNLELFRKELPEEFWGDFDKIYSLLWFAVSDFVMRVTDLGHSTLGMTDKEVGLQLHTYPKDIRSLIFPYRKVKDILLDKKARRQVFDRVRPTGNHLPGYTPTSSMNALIEESL
jgi:RNA ligase